MKFKIQHSIILLWLLMLVSCTGTKHLQQTDHLIKPAKYKITDPENTIDKRAVNTELKKIMRYNSNSKFLWMRPRLSIYTMIDDKNKTKGFRYWLKNKIGKAPYLFNAKITDGVNKAIQGYFFNSGYFNSTSNYTLITHKNEIIPNYQIVLNSNFTIASVDFLPGGFTVDSLVAELAAESSIKLGKPYNLNDLINERKRINNNLSEKGYYYFKPDYLEFQADSVSEKNKVKLTLKVKMDIPEDALYSYTYNQIRIFDDYTLNKQYIPKLIDVDNYTYYSQTNPIKPHVITNTIHMKNGMGYNRKMHLRTINQLRSINVYKFVNVIYSRDTSSVGKLNADILLVPQSKYSLSGELNATAKSNGFFGPGIKYSLYSRNVFKGAELFSINFAGRIESQIGEDISNLSYEIKLDGNLDIPRLFPMKHTKYNREYLPRTVINAGAGLTERFNYYQMLTWYTSLRYVLQTNSRISHKIAPIDINLTNLLQTTEEFNDFLNENPSVRRSFDEQFIVGGGYDFFYNSQSHSPFFLGLNVDFSGNALSLINNYVAGKGAPDSDNPFKLFDMPYSQFTRIRSDIRYTLKFNKKHSLAARAYAGVGLPYGNSFVMPYVKQFFVGGTNSLRGFPSRSIGPGTYQSESSEESAYIDQAGDLKIETNFEYRFPLWSVLKGAIFTDVGNIWLVNADSTRPGGEFGFETFAGQLAVNLGYGFRIDFDPIIIRFDYGFPVKYPYEKNGSKWQFENINVLEKQWRRDNLILNISLGYPF